VSAAALDIARQLFRDHPPVGHFAAPTFLRFDGHRIDLPDASVDRIICFDAFHHVPNPEDVIREFGRVLKPGGIAGFSEPGPAHSRSPQSQYEMTHHRVLENDIHLDELAEFARASGFTDVTVRTLADGTISVDQYLALINGPLTHESRQLALDAVRGPMTSRSIFFFSKGSPIPDSRGHVGLAHTLTVNPTNAFVPDGGSLALTVHARNTGQAIWLRENNSEIYGIVRVGTHLYGADNVLLNIDHSRHFLPRAVGPGDQIEMQIDVPLPTTGDCRIVVDLVAEGVTWFENAGSTAVSVVVSRTR